jgi:hypothetical protein
MTEPSKKEMLEALDELTKENPLSFSYGCIPAIRALIENRPKGEERGNRGMVEIVDGIETRSGELPAGDGPKVSREFVESKAAEYSLPLHWVYRLLREAGVVVEEECNKSSTLINKCKAIDTK